MNAKENYLKETKGQITKANGIDTWYETFGDEKNKPLLLIMGACCQGVLWHKEFCESLAGEGFYIIRYDHRDSGLSSCFDYETHPYGLMDMAKDAIGLLNAIGIKKTHIWSFIRGHHSRNNGWIFCR